MSSFGTLSYLSTRHNHPKELSHSLVGPNIRHSMMFNSVGIIATGAEYDQSGEAMVALCHLLTEDLMLNE